MLLLTCNRLSTPDKDERMSGANSAPELVGVARILPLN